MLNPIKSDWSNAMIRVENRFPKTAQVKRLRPGTWRVVQRHTGFHEHNQVGTWLRIDNPGVSQKIDLEIVWAEFEFEAIQYRRFGYLKHGRRYRIVQGEITPRSTRFRFEAPPGESWFGWAPWYDNDDAERLLRRICRRIPSAEAITIGKTLEGRPIRILQLKKRHSGKRPRPVVLLVAREHGTETAGSFAIEEVARHLMAAAPGQRLLRRFDFHLLPVANPDGVAHGRKLPQEGPTELSDLPYAGLRSQDPTCAAVRNYILSVKPAAFVNYHGYLSAVPAIIFYDRDQGMAMLDRLLVRKSDREAPRWYVRWQCRENRTMLHRCVRDFGTILGLFELPWAGQTMGQVRKLGLRMFQSVMDVVPHAGQAKD